MTDQEILDWERRETERRQRAAAETAQYRNKDALCNICGKYGHVDELHRFEDAGEQAWELAEMEGQQ